MAIASYIVLALLALAILSFYIGEIQQTDVYQFLSALTGYLFAIGITLGIVAFLLSIILFFVAAGNLRVRHRSTFWLIFAVTVITIGALIWGVFVLTQQFQK